MEVVNMNIADVKPYENNPRINDDAVEATANSIKEFGFQQPIVVDKDNVIIVGHTRLRAAKKLGLKSVPVVTANLTDEQAKAYRLADNKTGELADWDEDLLKIELDDVIDLDMTDFGFEDLIDTYDEETEKYTDTMEKNSLKKRFLIPPFSVLDTKQDDWQKRKASWLDLGIKSEIGRKDGLIFNENLKVGKNMKGTSVFDPVLTELIYRWFTPHENSNIIDPFAGGSVRGVVAGYLEHNYTGIDLRSEQIQANKENAAEIGIKKPINWIADNSLNIDNHVEDETQDLLIACPPYLDLEVYSDDEGDISNMSDEDFEKDYSEILKRTAKKLKQNRFAVIVVSDVRGRGKDTGYRDLTGMTKRAFIESGFSLYNEIIMANVIGSAAMRATRYMQSRKVARIHQEVLVFFKGDQKKIKEEFIPVSDLEESLKEYEE